MGVYGKRKNGMYIHSHESEFPEYVKIGFATDVEKRLQQLNSSTAVPFALGSMQLIRLPPS